MKIIAEDVKEFQDLCNVTKNLPQVIVDQIETVEFGVASIIRCKIKDQFSCINTVYVPKTTSDIKNNDDLKTINIFFKLNDSHFIFTLGERFYENKVNYQFVEVSEL